MMVQVFIVLLHVALLLAAVGQVTLIAVIILQFSSEMHEKIMRALATACGFLIYVGAKAVGLTIPDIMYKALSSTVPFSDRINGDTYAFVRGRDRLLVCCAIS